MPSKDGKCAGYTFGGKHNDAEADLAICLRGGDGLDTVNGNVKDHDGNGYEIASTEDGSHLWFVADMEKLQAMKQAEVKPVSSRINERMA